MGDVHIQIASLLIAFLAGLNVFIAGSSTFGEESGGAHTKAKDSCTGFSLFCKQPTVHACRGHQHRAQDVSRLVGRFFSRQCYPQSLLKLAVRFTFPDCRVEQFVVSREGKISKLEFFYDADQYSDAFQADLGSETDGEAHSGRSEKSLS